MIDTFIETLKTYILYVISLYLDLPPVYLNNDTLSWVLLSWFWDAHPFSPHCFTPPSFLPPSKASPELPVVSSPIQQCTWHAWHRRGFWIHNASLCLRWGFRRVYHNSLRLAGSHQHSTSLRSAEYRQSIPLVSLREVVQHPPTW